VCPLLVYKLTNSLFYFSHLKEIIQVIKVSFFDWSRMIMIQTKKILMKWRRTTNKTNSWRKKNDRILWILLSIVASLSLDLYLYLKSNCFQVSFSWFNSNTKTKLQLALPLKEWKKLLFKNTFAMKRQAKRRQNKIQMLVMSVS